MSTPTAVANVELAKVLSDNEDYVLSVTKSKAVDLSEKMFQSCLISDSMMDQFSSLDHSRVEPQLQLRYLFRLVNQRIQQDKNVGDRFLGLLESWGEQTLCEYLKRNITGNEQPEINRTQLVDHLCSDDISWILELLVDASHKWEALAIALGLHTYQRHNIKGDDNTDKLMKVLDVWLSGGSTTPPTVNTLTDAMRSKLVGQGRLAMKLEKQYKPTTMANEASKIKIRGTSNSPLTIDKQSPRRVEVKDRKSTILIAQASVRENLFYQWNKNGQALADNISSDVVDQTCYSGVHEEMLFINHAHQGTQGEYTCCVSNEERQVVSNKVTLTVLYTPEKKILLDTYSSVNTHVPLDEAWPPVGAETFIRPVLVKSSGTTTGSSVYSVERNPDKMRDKNKEIEYRDVFSTYRSASFLLIEGRPGSGKTTLVCKLIKDWAKGTVLAQAKLVFLVSLRTLINNHLQKNTLSEVLHSFYSSGATLEDLILDLERTNGEGVCFVFDGLDEYSPHKVDESVVFKILHRRYLSQAMIIALSRPGAMARLKQEVVTQHIEVLGFTKNQIAEYIDNFPFDSCADSSFGPSELKEYLRLHPNVLHMCYLPIHAAIICFVYNIKRGHLPHTQTKIYEEFTKSMILHHLRRNNAEVQVHSLKELPDGVNEYFNKLCLLAFEMTAELKQVINSNEITFPLSRDTSLHGDWSLGLVTCNRTAQLSGVSTSYMFLHLTLQEFLAAYYITSAEEEKKCQLVQRLISKTRFEFGSAGGEKRYMYFHKPKIMSFYEFEIVWIFCFGLETFQSLKELDVYQEIHATESFATERSIRYAFESQQQIVCDKDIRNFDGTIVLENMIPSDVPAVKFFASYSSQQIRKIVLVERGLHHIASELLEQIRHVKFPKVNSLRMHFTANTEALQNLSIILKSCGRLRHLELQLDHLTDGGGYFVANSMKYLNQLVSLRLSSSTLINTGQSPGLLRIISQLSCLSQLYILDLSIRVMDIKCCEVLASVLCLLGTMEQLNLEKNNINSEMASSLASVLHHLLKLKCLNLSDNTIGSEGAICLASQLHHLTKLQTLNLSSNTVGAEGANSLAAALQYLTQLECFHLSRNNIGSDSAINLASKLHHLIELKDLSLSENGIDIHSAIQVITALKDCQKLLYLRLNNNPISGFNHCRGFYLQGLVTSEDAATINCLISAVKLFQRDVNVHLGFKTINIQHNLQSSALVTPHLSVQQQNKSNHRIFSFFSRH